MERLPSIHLALRAASLVLACAVVLVAPARAQIVPTGFTDQIVVSGLDQPVALEFTPDGRVLVAGQVDATIRIVRNGALLATPVITVPNVSTSGELGLLGVALDPRFPAQPYLYTHQTLNGQQLHITRWTLTGDLTGTGDGVMTASPSSAFELLTDIPNDAANHNGGTVRFGPDQMLYVSLGEDADPCAAQDRTLLKGKILRLDVLSLPAGPGAATRAQLTPFDNPYAAAADSNERLVYAYGLRNPFRVQIDMQRGWLVVGDVGQDSYEELDLLAPIPARAPQTASHSASRVAAPGLADPGANFGWPWFEGFHSYSGASCSGSAPVEALPIFEIDRRSLGGAAIISAGAYHPRGGAADWPAAYDGDLFCAEYYSGGLTRLHEGASSWSVASAVAGQLDPAHWATDLAHPSDFRVGPDGALWYVSQWSGAFRNSGAVRRIAATPDTTTGPPPVARPAVRLSARPLPATLPVTLSYDLYADATTSLRVYDTRGRLVRTLQPARVQTVAHYDVTWDGADDDGRALPSGLYFARLEAGGEHPSVRLPLVR